MTDDPLVMYFVLRKDARLGLGQAMVLAGGAADACACEYARDERVADTWGAWLDRQRKVALRATGEEMDAIRGAELCAGDDTLICVVPQRRSEVSELLSSLRPFTDAKAPAEPPPPVGDDTPALVYLIRPGVMKTTGKAMAQAGHAALIGAAGASDAATWSAWREAGRPGEVLEAPPEEWDALRALPGAAVIEDGGLTQVEPGTETVIGLPPAKRPDWPAAVRDFTRVL